MILRLQRTKEINNATLGELYFGDKFLCYTLEDKVRAVKIKHETAIPANTYLITVTYSERFKKLLPLLLNVEGYTGIRIHPGNFIGDTSGCILLGSGVQEDRLLHSISAFAKVFTIIQQALKKETVQIDIIDIPKEILSKQPTLEEEQTPIIDEVTKPIIEIQTIQPQLQLQTTKTWKKNFWLNFWELILNLFKQKF